MINPRYGGPSAVILALALIPTAIHTYWDAKVTDGLTTKAIPIEIDRMTSTPTARRSAWVKNNFDTEDWTERLYQTAGDTVTLFVARSYDAKRLYHHPELALLRGTETIPAGVARAAARPEIPLHVIKTAKAGRNGIGVYALLYDGRFIENPIAFQLRTSAELLVSGRKQMTLFLASDLSGAATIDEALATRVLLAAISSFESQSATTERRRAAVPKS